MNGDRTDKLEKAELHCGAYDIIAPLNYIVN